VRHAPAHGRLPGGAPRWAAAIAAASLLLAAGCASQTLRPELLSKDAVVLDVPLMSQSEMYECGLVSISVLCAYYQVPIPPDHSRVLAAMAGERAGLSGAELGDALERLGFEVFLFEGTLDRAETGLYTQVDAARPLIVMTSPGGEKRHYLLFLGYDEPNGNVCLLDPVRGRVLEPRETFEHSWKRCQRFTLLALPKESATSYQEMLP
jgi:ABC-type bacteriocin/lantibiotic exporter with double-glycine peptidase domain